jgi:probable phosphoglycerate mutase
MNENLFENSASSAAAGEWLTAHCDGGSRGNPGPSGYGAVIEDAQGLTVAELSDFLGIQTNNYAEYSGLLAVLKWAIEYGAKHLRVVSDSELMVKQMQGKYKVASPILRPLWEEARRMSRRIESFEIRHTLRGSNKTADRLANEAMDKGMGKAAIAQAAKPADFAARRRASQPVKFAANRPSAQPAARVAHQTLEGYVKDGVVHLLEGELPDGIFVKIIRE